MTTLSTGLPPAAAQLDSVARLARQLRVDSIRATTAAGSGHPTSSMSAADLAAMLLTRHLRCDWSDPTRQDNDYFVLSKGHASPLLYAMYRAVGVIDEEELLSTYRRGGRLEGHPTPRLPWVPVATGSLGQGIAYAAGIALAGRALPDDPYRVWVLCGDGELAEGSVWEALDKAGLHRLDNLTVIVDVNRLGQTGPTEYGWDLDVYAARMRAFGASVLEIDGHDLAEIDEALETAKTADRPTVILARTVKGAGYPPVADSPNWHGKPLPEAMARDAISMLGGATDLRVEGPLPQDRDGEAGPESFAHHVPSPAVPLVRAPSYQVGERVATRKAYGNALLALGDQDPDVVVLDGEVGNSTGSQEFERAHPERYFQMYISEQQLVAAAVGLAARGWRPYAATFAAFLSRAHDFLRMTAIDGPAVRMAGSHCGVEIGADGPSQMGLEDLAMMRALHGSTVLYPCDATSAAKLTVAMNGLSGISYLRTTRGAYPVLYRPEEDFPIGGSKLWGEGADDVATLVGAGVTLHECLDAATELAHDGLAVRVLDLYSIKPVDAVALRACAEQTPLLITVEDHRPEGGIGEAVASALADVPCRLRHLAVRDLPGSDSTAHNLAAAGIDSRSIAAAVRESAH
ncbi:transketolase [Actinospica durhamensis]|uniref:Transketolase n=1 Tax=Actinospica durhamensis TaxID=1508375 RepID=A0A941IUI8_9ACTN|nr:transketolase [Actinospica durhamensis]MBR7835616.1 transketolase [Actinospica durhamensis]